MVPATSVTLGNSLVSDNQTETGDRTHFGFRNVSADEKTSLVRDVFNSVAPKYDLMNDLMSGGIHRLWKADLIRAIAPRDGQAILDLGGGTGDIAFGVLAKANCDVTVCDINAEMLVVGRDRGVDRGLLDGPQWTCGNGEQLPIPDSSMDIYVSAFCLRNVTRLHKALGEARRILKPGGHFLCLEFSTVALPLLSEIYDRYSFEVLPLLGQVVAGDKESYQYLAESIRRFPDQENFAAMIEEAGLDQVTYQNVSAGIAAIHSAWRI